MILVQIEVRTGVQYGVCNEGAGGWWWRAKQHHILRTINKKLQRVSCLCTEEALSLSVRTLTQMMTGQALVVVATGVVHMWRSVLGQDPMAWHSVLSNEWGSKQSLMYMMTSRGGDIQWFVVSNMCQLQIV